MCIRDSRNGAGAAPASELGLGGETVRVADLAKNRRCGNWADAIFVTQCGFVSVEQTVDLPFQRTDLSAGLPVPINEVLEPKESVTARSRQIEIISIEMSELSKP